MVIGSIVNQNTCPHSDKVCFRCDKKHCSRAMKPIIKGFVLDIDVQTINTCELLSRP